MNKTKDAWIDVFNQYDAWWTYCGDPRQPHAILHSGLHSNGFFMSKLVTKDDVIRRQIAEDMISIFTEKKLLTHRANCIIGCPSGATLLAKDIQRIGFNLSRYVEMEKKETDGEKSMHFVDEHFINPGESVLLIEDTTTTAGSFEITAEVISEGGGIVMPIIFTLVNRSGKKMINGREIVALVDYPMETWNPKKEICPLCAAGSEAIRPKVPESNWGRLKAIPA